MEKESTMAISDVIIAEMMEEAEATKRVFQRLPEDRFSWRPHEKSRSIGQLALHIAQVPMSVCWLAAPDVSEVPTMVNDPEPKNRTELLNAFEENLAKAREILAGWDDDRMMGPLTFQKDSKSLFTMPRMAFLRNVLLNHNYHHRGQLTVYLRLLNIPVPFIYGPSADENPFAGM